MNSVNAHSSDHKMGGHTCKNDVKLLFYIFNTFSTVGTGLLLFSWGIGTGVHKKMETSDIWSLVVGLAYIVVGCVGYRAATVENKKMLESYTTLMIVRSINNVVQLVKLSKFARVTGWAIKDADGVAPEDVLVAMILDTIVAMVTTLLSLTLAAKAPKSTKAADADKQAVVPIKPLV